jgi:hypothetical protein
MPRTWRTVAPSSAPQQQGRQLKARVVLVMGRSVNLAGGRRAVRASLLMDVDCDVHTGDEIDVWQCVESDLDRDDLRHLLEVATGVALRE